MIDDPVSLLVDCDIPWMPLFLDMAGTFCVVDHVDWAWAKDYMWSKKHTQRTSGHKVRYYAYRTASIMGVRMSAYLHVLIAKRAYGAPPRATMVVDHINGNTLDCRRANLRWASRSQNRRNVEGSRVRKRLLLEALVPGTNGD